jgi:hypothetical protein
MTIERITTVYPAYDKRNPDPTKNYGIHSAELKMVLKGELGAVQFLLYTGWYLEHVARELYSNQRRDYEYSYFTPQPADLGYHSTTPRYEGQPPSDECEYLEGKPCYYDGSSLNARKPYELLITLGSEAVWKYLEEYYIEKFGELK